MHLSNFKKIQAQKNLNVNISRFGHVHKKKAIDILPLVP